MFFALSKILFALIRPWVWVLLLLIIAWRSKREKVRKTALGIVFLFLLMGSNRALLNSVAALWEPMGRSVESIGESYDVGILLGGYSNGYGYPDDGRLHLNSSANRFTQALELYQQGKIKKILLSGGWGRLIGSERVSEARAGKAYLVRFGIPASDILLETESRNTRENALFSKQLLAQMPGRERCLLITSAWHMRRASACFDKIGLPMDTYCVDYMRNTSQSWWQDVLSFNPDLLQRWESLFKEWLGIVAYRLKGYI